MMSKHSITSLQGYRIYFVVLHFLSFDNNVPNGILYTKEKPEEFKGVSTNETKESHEGLLSSKVLRRFSLLNLEYLFDKLFFQL